MQIETNVEPCMSFEEIHDLTMDCLKELGVSKSLKGFKAQYDDIFNQIFAESWQFDLSKKKAVLPLGFLKEKLLACSIASEQMGYDSEHPKYEKFMRETLKEFLDEAFEESLTPSGQVPEYEKEDEVEMMSNPSTPVLPEMIFDANPEMKDIIKKVSGSEDEFVSNWTAFRSAVASITQVYVKTAFGMKTKEKDKTRQNRNLLSDFQYPKNATIDERATVLVNHYVRYAVAMKILSSIEKAFQTRPEDFQRVFENFISVDLDKDSAQVVYDRLNKNANRVGFCRQILKYYREGGK